MSNYSKGKKLENITADELKTRGYEIFFKSIFVRFQNIDFGPWDIVAGRGSDGIIPRERVYVQCTSWENRSTRRIKCKEWIDKHALSGELFYLVSRKKVKGKWSGLIWESL
jgi:hypothetical protein